MRPHAKADVAHRDTGFGSVDIGTANVSRAALSEGLEWTSKISPYGLPHLRKKIVETFESARNDHGFEWLDRTAAPKRPAGGVIRFERVAQQRVLENLWQSLTLRYPQMIGDIREPGRHLGHAPAIRETLEYLNATLDELLTRGLGSRLLSDARLAPGGSCGGLGSKIHLLVCGQGDDGSDARSQEL
jgi:hypothetical protein